MDKPELQLQLQVNYNPSYPGLRNVVRLQLRGWGLIMNAMLSGRVVPFSFSFSSFLVPGYIDLHIHIYHPYPTPPWVVLAVDGN